MTCQDTRELFLGFLHNELSPRQRRRVDHHLAECPACNQELQDISEMWTRLGVFPEVRPSRDLRKRFYQRLETIVQTPAPVPAPDGKGWRKWIPRLSPSPVVQLIPLALLVIAGFGMGLLTTGVLAPGGAMRSMQREMVQMKQLLAGSLLQQQSPSYRIMGANQSANISRLDPTLIQILSDTLNGDANVNVRLATVDAIYRHRRHPQIRQLAAESLGKQTSPLVQISLIELLSDLPGEQSRQALRDLSQREDVHPQARESARQALNRLEGLVSGDSRHL